MPEAGLSETGCRRQAPRDGFTACPDLGMAFPRRPSRSRGRPIADDAGDLVDAVGQCGGPGLQDDRGLDLMQLPVADGGDDIPAGARGDFGGAGSEEHTAEPQSLMRIMYARLRL